MGIYSKIFQAGKKMFQQQKQPKQPKTKRMKKIKLSPEQKAKLRGVVKKASDYVTSGKMQTSTALVTRYAQGKPVVIKRPMTKEQREAVPDTFQVFGYPVKKTYVYVGGGLLALGAIAYGAKKRKRN